MKILITNDDGYSAKGIRTLARIMKRFGDVAVIAPKRHQSGTGMSVSIGMKPIAYKDLGTEDGISWAYLDATPASCVKFAMNFSPFGVEPDIVVSGINHGSNASSAGCYSGTLGAAAEAAVYGIHAIGVSLDDISHDADFSHVEKHFPSIVESLVTMGRPRYGIYYDVNFPSPKKEVKGIRVASMGYSHWVREFHEWDPEYLKKFGDLSKFYGDPREVHAEDGEKLYMMIGTLVDNEENPSDADHHFLAQGYITVSAHNAFNSDQTEIQRMLSFGLDRDF